MLFCFSLYMSYTSIIDNSMMGVWKPNTAANIVVLGESGKHTVNAYISLSKHDDTQTTAKGNCRLEKPLI